MNTEKNILIIDKPFPAEDCETPFGERYGAEKITLTSEHLSALQEGKTLALDIRGEYVLFLSNAQSKK